MLKGSKISALYRRGHVNTRRQDIVKVGFIFTNYKNTQYTEGALLSILGSDANDAHIVVVDNASGLEHAEALNVLETRHDNLKVIYNKENVGYFRGLNVGIKYARESFGNVEYWIIGNNDLIFPENIYSSVMSCQKVLKKYPVISPNIVTLDGVQQNPHVIAGISKFREFIYDLYHFNYRLAGLIKKTAQLTSGITDRDDESQHEVAQEIYQGYGACYVLSPVFFQNFKELWSPTFLMYEEYFLSKQLEDKGFKIYYEPAIKIKHHWHSATDKLPGRLRWELCRDAHREYRKYVKIWRK